MPGCDGAAYLDARDARAARAARLVDRTRSRRGSVVWLTVNIPGPDKRRPGVDDIFIRALQAVLTWSGAESLDQGVDLLGPFAAIFVPGDPAAVKRAAVALEEDGPERRLIDIDVCDEAGVPVDRARLGLPQRPCLVCPEPARDCIRLQRHAPHALAAAVSALLPGTGPAPPPADALARSLVAGAQIELDLTPKPGLVDRRDNGSHPDLSYDLMARSIALLPSYFDELLAVRRAGADLDACIESGRRAERRMFDAIGANAHRGYIFLGGLLLLAACDAERRDSPSAPAFRDRVRALARDFFSRDPEAAPSVMPRNPRAQARHGIDGIRTEALAGLPSVFDVGIPVFDRALAETGDFSLAAYALMGNLMQQVDDTTAVRRCGPEGLARLRRDGATLVRLLSSGSNPVPALESWNDEYRQAKLTMGGVADCMAAVFALRRL